MEKIIIVLCVGALSLTAIDGAVEFTGVELPGFTPAEEEETKMSTIESVTVPEQKLRDIVHYDHIIRIELYFENKSSGDWTFWALDVSGQELIKIPGTVIKPDGYGGEHSVMFLRRELSAQFTVFLDDSDGEAITSDGEYDVQRDEYTDLNEEKTILIDTNANISVDELPSTNIPLSFRGFMRSYFDPHEPKLETLEDSIYGEGQTVKLGDDGYFIDEMSWYDLRYNWVAQRGEIIAGYETVLINVSTDLGDENFSVPFMELIWISNEVSMPVKQFIHTNTSWDSEDEAGYILIQNTFTLRENGFSAGNQPIPWGECNGYHWLNVHPWAETEDWSGNYMPKSGSAIDESSFDFKTEDVIHFLTSKDPDTNQYPSNEFMNFLNEYSDAIVTNAEYNASKDNPLDEDDKEGEYWWNLTFGHKKGDDEPGSSRWYDYQYRVLVYQKTTSEWVTDPVPHKEYKNEFRLDKDFGVMSGASPLAPYEISSQTVTMASSEKIFKTDDKVMENFYPYADLGREELDWGDGDGVTYSLGASGGEQGFGMDLIETLTGIQTQTWSKYYWSVAKEDLMQGGTMASASLDAESGRLISVMEIEGTALQNAFKFGD